MPLNEKLCVCENCLANNMDNNANALYTYIGYYTILKVPEDKICLKCGHPLKEYSITKEEFINIYKISKEPEFLKSMVKLHDEDIVEYNLKMSQFKANLSTQKAVEEENKPHCPHCKSINIKSISGLNRGASIAMWGIFSKKINKSFECKDCGYTW